MQGFAARLFGDGFPATAGGRFKNDRSFLTPMQREAQVRNARRGTANTLVAIRECCLRQPSNVAVVRSRSLFRHDECATTVRNVARINWSTFMSTQENQRNQNQNNENNQNRNNQDQNRNNENQNQQNQNQNRNNENQNRDEE